MNEGMHKALRRVGLCQDPSGNHLDKTLEEDKTVGQATPTPVLSPTSLCLYSMESNLVDSHGKQGPELEV